MIFSTVIDTLLRYWPVFPAVFAAGIVDAIAGGGGLITLPVYMLVGLLLTSVAHLTLKEANGLTKAINMTTNVTSLVVFLINGTVLIPLGIMAGLCNIAGNWIGVALFTPHEGNNQRCSAHGI